MAIVQETKKLRLVGLSKDHHTGFIVERNKNASGEVSYDRLGKGLTELKLVSIDERESKDPNKYGWCDFTFSMLGGDNWRVGYPTNNWFACAFLNALLGLRSQGRINSHTIELMVNEYNGTFSLEIREGGMKAWGLRKHNELPDPVDGGQYKDWNDRYLYLMKLWEEGLPPTQSSANNPPPPPPKETGHTGAPPLPPSPEQNTDDLDDLPF